MAMKELGVTPAKSTDVTTMEVHLAIPSYAQGQGLLNQFDQRRSVYNWKGSNTRRLRRGMAFAARGGRTDHLCVGDSATVGCNSIIGTTLFDRLNSWPYAMRNSLAGMGVPVGGTGLMRAVDGAYYDSQRYSFAGTWINQLSSASSTTNASTYTCTPDVGGTILEIGYFGFSGGGTFTVSINGATSGVGFITVVTNQVTSAWMRVRMPGVAIVGNQSKIVLTVTSGGSGVYFRGFNVFTPNGGLVMHNTAQSGATATGTGTGSWTDGSIGIGVAMRSAAGVARQVTDAVFNATNTMTSATAAFTAADIGSPVDMFTVPATGPVIPENVVITAVGSATSVTLSAAAYVSASAQTISIDRDPSCIHLALGFNDLSTGSTVAAVVAALATMRGWFPNSDAIIHLAEEGPYALVSQAIQNQYTAAMYALADTLDIPLFDWRDRIGNYAQAQAIGVYGDTVHLVPSAYAMVGSFLAEIIGESSGKTQMVSVATQDIDAPNKKYVDDLTKATTTANNATVTTTVETVIMKIFLPANSCKVGSTLDFRFFMHPGATTITTTRVRCGPLGTSADAAVVTIAATVTTNAGSRQVDGVVSVQASGASATILGGGTESVGAISAAGVATATSGTFDTTKDNFISITVQNTSSTTTTVYAGRAEFSY